MIYINYQAFHEVLPILIFIVIISFISGLIEALFSIKENNYKILIDETRAWDTDRGLQFCNYKLYQHYIFKFIKFKKCRGYRYDEHPYYKQFKKECKND
jgi:hypothetical protein